MFDFVHEARLLETQLLNCSFRPTTAVFFPKILQNIILTGISAEK